jgi:SAM-dependent methyltransferase
MITDEQARQIAALESKYPGHPMAKFCRHPRAWYAEAEQIARDMGLHELKLPRIDILDIGCGFGYFLKVCAHYGHGVLGCDLPDDMIMKAQAILKVPAVGEEVKPLQGLHPTAWKFDLITTFGVNFRWNPQTYWGVSEYIFLANDLRSRLRPSGRWVLRPNQTDDKTSLIARLMEADWWRTVAGSQATITISPPEVTIQWPNN